MQRRLTSCIYAIAAAYGVTLLAVTPKWTVDDAYITFRYARNLAEHGQLTWNVGEDPVEGYTGVAWPVMLAALMHLGVEPRLASHLVGGACYFLCAILVDRILSCFDVRALIRAVAVLACLAAPMMAVHALSGLETLMFVCAILASLWQLAVLLRRRDVPPRHVIILSLILLWTGLTRPEGAALPAAVAPALFWHARRVGDGCLRRILVQVGVWYILPACAYFAWRWGYYGHLLPNTFYAKIADDWGRLKAQANLRQFIRTYLWVFGAAAGVILLPHVHRIITDCRRRAVYARYAEFAAIMGAAALFMAVLVWQYLHTDPVMSFAFRYCTPLLLLALVTCGVLSEMGWRFMQRAPFKSPLCVATAAALALLAVRQSSLYRIEQTKELTAVAAYQRLLLDEHLPLAEFVHEHVPRHERLITYVDAGAIPYHTQLPTVDFGRLNDEYLAAAGPTPADEVDYFFSHDAAAVAMISLGRHGFVPFDDTAQAVVADPRFRRYRLVREYRSWAAPDYRMLLFLRHDLAAPGIDELDASFSRDPATLALAAGLPPP